MELNSDTMKKIRGLIVFTVVIVVAGINYRRLVDVAAGLMHIVWPFILGAAIAFILNVPMRNIERHLTVFGEGSRLRRPVSLVVTILLVTGGLFLVIFVVAPQLVKTFMNLQSSIPVFFAGVRDEAERIFASNPQILEYMNQMEVDWQEVFQNMVAFLKSGAGTMLNTTFSAAVSIVSGVSSFLIGFIFAIYILLQKETLGRQIKKLLEAFLPEPAVYNGPYRAHLLPFSYRTVRGGCDSGNHVFCGTDRYTPALCTADWGADCIYGPDSYFRSVCGTGSGRVFDAHGKSYGCTDFYDYLLCTAADRGKPDISLCGGKFGGSSFYMGAGGRDRGR